MIDLEQATINKELVALALGQLSERSARVVRMRYGLDGDHPLLYREIGEEIGVSKGRVSQIDETALRRIRHYFQRIGVMPAPARPRKQRRVPPPVVEVAPVYSRPRTGMFVPKHRVPPEWFLVRFLMATPWTFTPSRLTSWPGSEAGCWRVAASWAVNAP